MVAGARRVLVLESVNDHENIGALFRNAAAFGVDAVVLDPTTSDPLYRRSTRVSLGHVLRVPFARVDDDGWPSALDELRALGFVTVALTPDPTAEPLGVARGRCARRASALVLGAEGPGLTDAALAAGRPPGAHPDGRRCRLGERGHRGGDRAVGPPRLGLIARSLVPPVGQARPVTSTTQERSAVSRRSCQAGGAAPIRVWKSQ